MTSLTDLQKRICNELQSGLEIIEQPFEAIANRISCPQSQLLEEIKTLKQQGIIRRISASINYAALGRISTLVTAHVPQEKVEEIAATINALAGVSHNYLRDHYFNLWFTLQADSESAISEILGSLQKSSGIEFHSLPAIKVFKLDVRFDAFSQGTSLLPFENKSSARQGVVTVTQQEKELLKLLQADLPFESRPFGPNLEMIRSLHDRGVLKHIAAVVDYRKLGFTANAMAVFAVELEAIDRLGREIAGSNVVSHCYHRLRFENWPYTLFAMMHGRQLESLQKTAADFASANGIADFKVLPTIAELKKKPVAL